MKSQMASGKQSTELAIRTQLDTLKANEMFLRLENMLQRQSVTGMRSGFRKTLQNGQPPKLSSETL